MGKKILVVDDDPVTRTMIARAVEKMGGIVIQASNGKVAWFLLKDNPDIALVVTDHRMPGLSGKRLTQKMRHSPQHADIPILMISGYIPLGEISSLLELGVTRFMPKPLNPSDLKEYLELLMVKKDREGQLSLH